MGIYDFKSNHDAWNQGYIDGCINMKGTYNSVPATPNLTVRPGENSFEIYYKDGFNKGEAYALQSLAGNYKPL